MSVARCAVATTVLLCRSTLSRVAVLQSQAACSNCCRSLCTIIKKEPDNMYIAEERGALYSPDYRIYFRDESGPISPMHDIPLWADKPNKLVNMVVEVPRWSNAKMEISLSEPLNPIKQDVKKGALRFVANIFPHHGYIWNYGALPQTWESPQHIHPDTQARGDNDPIDVIEIGSVVRARGDVVAVRVLGALALLDEGETDWKLLAVAADDPELPALLAAGGLAAQRPGLLHATREWFRTYKIPDGKPPNEFAFDGELKDADYAYRVIDEVHEQWRELVARGAGGISTARVVEEGAAGGAGMSRAAAADVLAAAPPPSKPRAPPHTVDKWHYLSCL